MKNLLAKWSLILLCLSMAGAIGGGLFEHIVLMPLWSESPFDLLVETNDGKGYKHHS